MYHFTFFGLKICLVSRVLEGGNFYCKKKYNKLEKISNRRKCQTNTAMINNKIKNPYVVLFVKNNKCKYQDVYNDLLIHSIARTLDMINVETRLTK